MPQNWWDGFQLFCWMVGAGGIPTIIVALLGRKKAQASVPPATPPPLPQQLPVEMTSPWLVQNLLEMKLTIEGVKKNQETIVSSINTVAVQVSALNAKLRVRKATK